MEWSALEQPVVLIPLIGVLGLLVGSFLNVVILRLPRRLEHDWKMQAREFLGQEQSEAVEVPPDLVFKGSHCPHCKHELSPLDNIPLMSFVFLRGRCRYCKTAISWQYPLVELISGIACATIALKFGFGWPLLAGLAFTWILIAASGIDARTQLLPDQLTLPLSWIGLLISLIPVFIAPADAILGAAIGWLSLWSVFWLFKLATGKEGMGYGDFKLLAALGAWLGWQMLPAIILLSSVVGAVVGVSLIVVARHGRNIPIPFGPYLAAAGAIALFWGNAITKAYLGTIG